jgi:hypothetical protein
MQQGKEFPGHAEYYKGYVLLAYKQGHFSVYVSLIKSVSLGHILVMNMERNIYFVFMLYLCKFNDLLDVETCAAVYVCVCHFSA